MTALRKLDVIVGNKPSRAGRRVRAWARVLDAVTEMRDALECRVARQDFFDIHLEHDVRALCELTRALADFLKAKQT